MAEKYLKIPLTEEDVRGLKIGDVVFLDGPVYTGRSLFHIRAIDQNIIPSLDFKQMNVLMHIGPVMEKADDSWRPVSMAPTSSIRFEKYGAAIIKKLGIRAIIGKTTMGSGTMEMMKEFGAVHLTVVGIMGNLLANQVKRVLGVYFLEELGRTEATWVMELEKGGPFIVDIDTKGNNLFHQVNRDVESRFEKFYEKFGIPKGFEYTDVNA
jgi:tartrate/fumarate subfamily iron-sulfur-dependent hydro-lyase beta chain